MISCRSSYRDQGHGSQLARLVYRMLRYGMQFVDRVPKFYEAQHRKQQITYLKWKAAKLGFKIIEASAA
jgi:hypothetical protein